MFTSSKLPLKRTTGPEKTSPQRSTNESWFDRSRKVIAGGVDSPVRSFSAVGGTPFTVVRGSGAYLFDVEGNRYVDFIQSYGAVLLGHAHPVVTEAIKRAAADGTTYGAPTTGEVLLAEAICGRVAGCDQVRLVSSGTEAAMSAVRLARGYTGRNRIVKFAGCYHGHSDALLAGGGSGVATLGLAGSAGVPPGAVADTLVVPYNEVPDLDETVAAVIVEPVAANMNLVAPADGFLDGVRRACDAVGALLIFDEVITGFRLAAGGASATFEVRPDLWCFGKVIGGGLPVGALGGSAQILAYLAPDGPVYQAGTLSGNPLATAAGLAVLSNVDDAAYAQLTARAARFADRLTTSITDGGLAASVISIGPLVGLFVAEPGDGLGHEPGHDPEVDERTVRLPRNYDEARAIGENGVYRAFFHALLERGVALPPGPYEVMFPGLAHTDDDFAVAIDAAGEAATQVAGGLFKPR